MKMSLQSLYAAQTQLEKVEKSPLTIKSLWEKVCSELEVAEEAIMEVEVDVPLSKDVEQVVSFLMKGDTATTATPEEELEEEEEVEEEEAKTEEEKKVEGRTFSSPRKFSPVPPLAKDDI